MHFHQLLKEKSSAKCITYRNTNHHNGDNFYTFKDKMAYKSEQGDGNLWIWNVDNFYTCK